MNVYLRAAQEISDRDSGYSCTAVWIFGGDDQAKRYADMFAPAAAKLRHSRFIGGGHWLKLDTPEERHEWRLTALCFAAAMLDTSDI